MEDAPPQARRLEPEGDNPAALACSYVLPTSAYNKLTLTLGSVIEASQVVLEFH